VYKYIKIKLQKKKKKKKKKEEGFLDDLVKNTPEMYGTVEVGKKTKTPVLKKNFNLIIIIKKKKKEVLCINAKFYTSIKNTKNLDIKSSKKNTLEVYGKINPNISVYNK
jgi:hypothetical protein